MSIRTALQQVLHVAPPIEMQHATNFPDTATSNASLSATTCCNTNSDAAIQATSSATVAQQVQEELRDLVLEVMALVDEPQADWQSYVDAALADPDDALTCYTSLKQELGQQMHQEAPTRHP